MQMGQQPLMLFGATPAHSSTTFNPPGQLPRPDDPRSRTSKTETEGQRSSQSSPPSNQGAGSGSQRSIDTTFQVNPTNGTASLSVPLPVTAGRGSLTPDLNLCYDSGFGNGLFGLGWQIPFDTVTRKTSNSIPRYDTTSPTEDTYILFNVDELVPSGELAVIDHWLVQKFRPRLETQPGKIERWTGCKDATDVHWRAISGDNQTTLFGLDDSSRVSNTDANGSKCIFSWLCCYAYDAYGNAMQYEYKGENSNDVPQCYEGQYDTARSTPSKHIKRIRYGNRTPNRDLQSWKPHHALKTQHWLFEVVFDYGEHDYNAPQPSEIRPWELRLDCFSNYRAGYEIRTQRICKRILVFHHMPEKLDGAHICVSSAELQFHEAETGSLLERVIVRGLGAEGKTETLPVQRFGYHRKPAIETVQLQVADIPGLRTGSDLNTLGQWVDLESEGAPGLLHVCPEGAWTYRRNANGVLCSGNMLLQCTSETLPSHPSVGLVSESYYLEDLDRNGSLDLVALNKSRCPYGYQERVSGKWEVFQSFTKVPSFELDHSLTRRIDVTGSGLSDIVTIDENTNEVIWYENLGKEGFGQERRVPRRDNRLSFGSNDPTVMITLADMSGDGLQDVVRVANGRISYFSNLGYGCFSSERVMSCSPVFDRDDTFTFKRIMLVDLDGSGLSDVVYLPPQGGLHVYRNLCGSGWGPRQLNSNFPAIDNLSAVFPLDLFGNGTICLCWVGDDFQSSAACPLFYIDFHMGNKPCLLEWVENGMGKKTTFSYRPSTWFYRQDEVHGTPWKSKVPFPIHCVELMTVEDRIRQTSVRRRYAYHDGFYDGVESQFRGFGMVEQWDCEDFRGLQGFKRPPVLTKSWFAVGDHIPGHKLPRAFSENVLKWQNLPQYGSRAEEADVVRATKGIKLREEIYGIDGSARQDLPYSVTEYSHEIQQRQSLTGTQFGVYSIITKEQMTYAYERIKTNPRIEHSLVLQVNEFGLALKTAAISYGVPSSGLDDPVNRARQEETFITYSETIYTECVDTRHSYRSPLISQTKSYAVVGALKGQRFATIEDLTNDNFAFISKLPLIPLSQASLIHRKTPFKSLTSESVTTFRSQNLSKILHHEKLEEYAIPEQTFRLAIDSQMLDETCPSFYQPDDVMISRSGYVDLHGDGNLWQASARARFGEGPDELTCARRTFYEPSIVVDTFGNKMRTEFDDYILMVTKATDALGNTTETEYDYRTMNMVNMTDPNGNHTGFLYDALGRQIASAMSGKAGEEVGDTLAGVDLDPDYGRLEAFLHNPRDEYGRNLLGKSSNRTIYIHKHTEEAEVAGVFGPSCQVSLSRTRNASEDPDLKVGEIQVEVVYFDGSSQPVQIAHLYSVEEKTPTWRFSGWETLDNKGALVKTHQPSFRETPAFNFECNVNSPATINLRDPLGRAVAVFYPNHAWEKTTFTPWSRMVYDEGDLIDVSDPRSDSEVGDLFKVLDPKYFMPSWLDCKLSASNKDKWERDAAQKSKAYANHPDSHHFNALGQTIYTVVDDGGRKLSKTLQYDVAGNVCSSSDAMGRGVECISYDYLGRSLKKMQMDAGESWVILDCNGKSLVEGNNAGYIVEHIYDELQRRTQTFLRRAGGFKALITNIIYGENLPDSKSRNQRQQIVCVQDQSGVVNYEAFDFRGNCSNTLRQFAKDYRSVVDWSKEIALETERFAMSTKHDALSRSIETLNTNGCLIVREYNLVSDLTALYSKDGSEQKWTTRISKIEYESDGLPMKIYYGNGARKTYRYDVNTRKPLRICISSSSKDLSEDIVHYYDCRGNLTHQMNSAQDVIFYRNSKIDPSRDYTYDSLGRLIKALGREQIDVKNGTARSARPHGKGSSNLTTSFTPTDAKSVCAYQETYKYDDAGNILDLQHEALDKSIAGWTRTYNYKARSLLNQAQTSNKLTSTAIGSIEEHFSYDDIAGKMGCMTAMSGYSSISWDYGGRLRSSSTQVQKKGVPEMTWYIYDYQGQRVRKVTDAASSVASSASKSKDILYLPQAELQRTYSASQTRARKEIQTSKITGAKDAVVVLLETIETDDALVQLTRYQIGEHLELDANGLLISYEEYSPFGTSTFCAVRSNVSAPSKYRWGAYERDAESGMMHCGARYYAPWLGRWISCDPAGTADGDNLYCYVGNDPVNYHDPSGLVKAEKLGSNRVDTSANNTSAPGRSKGCFQKFCECLSGAFSFGRAGRPLLGANATAMERNSELQQFNQTVPHGITGIAGQSNMSEYNAGQAADLTMNANVRRTNQSIHPRQFPNVLRYAELVEDKGVQSQRGEGVQSQRGEGVQSQRGEGVQSQRGEGVQSQRGEGVQVQRGEGVQSQRAEVVQSEPAESWGSIVQVSYTDESDLIEMLGLLNAGENRVGQQGAEKIGGQWEGAKTEPNASLVLEDLDGPNEAVRKTKSLTLR